MNFIDNFLEPDITGSANPKETAIIKHGKIVATILLGIVILGYGFVYSIYPFIVDDILYAAPRLDFMEKYRINFRIANIATMLLLQMPRWLYGIVSATVLMLTLLQMMRIARIPSSHPTWGAAMITCYIILFPWHEYMFVTAYMLNYSVSSLLFLILTYLFFRANGRLTVTALIIPLLYGAWHEGFSTPAFCGFSLLLLLNIKKTRIQQWIIWALLIPGLLFLFSSSPFQTRLGGHGGLEFPDLSLIFNITFPRKHPLAFIYITALIICLIIPHWRYRCAFSKSSEHWFFITATVVSLIIQCKHHLALRPGWTAELCSLCGTFLLLRAIGKDWRPLRISVVVAWLFTGFIALHIIVLDIGAWKFTKITKNIYNDFMNSDNGVIFADGISEYDQPLLSLKRYNPNAFFNVWTYECFKDGWYPERPLLTVVPTALKNVTDNNGRKLPGNNPFYITQGHLWTPVKDDVSLNKFGIPDTSTGFWTTNFGTYSKVVEYEYIYFRGKDGKLYLHAHPKRVYSDLLNGAICEMNPWNKSHYNQHLFKVQVNQTVNN